MFQSVLQFVPGYTSAFFRSFPIHAPLAQSVEQRSRKAKVVRSIRTGGLSETRSQRLWRPMGASVCCIGHTAALALSGPVALIGRAPASQADGCEFKSRRVHFRNVGKSGFSRLPWEQDGAGSNPAVPTGSVAECGDCTSPENWRGGNPVRVRFSALPLAEGKGVAVRTCEGSGRFYFQ